MISDNPSLSAIDHARHVLVQNKVSLLALVFLVLLVVVAILAPWIIPHDPLATRLDRVLVPPGTEHWFGTDQVGRDVFSRVLIAARLDLAIAFSSVLISFLLGMFIGGAAALWGGWLDRAVGRITDLIMTFPLFVIAMALVAAIGNSLESIIVASAVVNMPFFIRLSRAEVSQLRVRSFVEAARVGGARDTDILLRFMLPNAMPTMIVQVSTGLGWAILNAASLSFIGLGIRPPTAEWGIMVAEGATSILAGQWWLAFFPGAALAMTVLCFNLLGDGLRDILDVRSRA
ncbi:ABC transporter permease [Bradyrhizobium elkanii]|uniref:ABC transporter permease n=1 Tax=Bradyrhizobium elkanii TaxID=29448 RepID=UPI003516E1CA